MLFIMDFDVLNSNMTNKIADWLLFPRYLTVYILRTMYKVYIADF